MAKTQTAKSSKSAAKKKQVIRPAKGIFRKQALGHALKTMLKKKGGRTDIEFEDAPKCHHTIMMEVPIEKRAGYPVERKKGSVDPATWRTQGGKEVIVDFSRSPWLPNDWGQGVKSTNEKKNKKTNCGGTYTVFVSPDGRVFYHRFAAEEHYGKPFSLKLGFDGQVRTARIQALEAVQVARASIKEINSNGRNLGFDSDKALFKLLTGAEKNCLEPPENFHFCVISARRATEAEGIRNLWMVQSQFQECGVNPTWYVDAESLPAYKKLGLKAVVGGKLTPARNKAIEDAQRMKKICVQCSDDISAWEYRDGDNAADKSDDACNAAYDEAQRLVLSPLAAAKFILAKMRCSPDKPKLGGAYMLASCARTFGGDAFATRNFILGDFFVVDVDNKLRFDESMTLKEDYDFTCANIHQYGAVLRCQRMTLRVKHYDNAGGACTNRDKKGKEEQKNIAILKQKWPRAIRDHHKRKNEVILQWPVDNDAKGLVTPPKAKSKGKKDAKASSSSKSKKVIKVAGKRTTRGAGAHTVDRVQLKCSPNAKLVPTGKVASSACINARMKKVEGKRVCEVLGKVKYQSKGETKTYSHMDLKYDQQYGYLTLKAR